MNEPDQYLKSLFQEMKMQDQRQAVPERNEMLKQGANKRSVWWKWGVAAALSGLGLWVWLWNFEPDPPYSEQPPVEWQVTESLTESPDDLGDWESPTDYLMESY